MESGDSVGTRLRVLKARSRMSLQDIADAMNMKRPTVQRYFKDEYRPAEPLPVDLAIKIAGALAGKGEPPVTRGDVIDLTGLPQVASAQPHGFEQLPYEVAEAIAEVMGKMALGREPEPDVVEGLAHMLTALSQLYSADPAARHDPAQTRGALKILSQQFGLPRRE